MNAPASPDEHAATRDGLRAGGWILIGIGVLAFLVTTVNFLAAMESARMQPIGPSAGSGPGGGTVFIGLVGTLALAGGIAMLRYGYVGPVARYVAREAAPAVREIVREELAAGVACPACRAANRPTARFCDACGAALGAPPAV